MLEHASIHSLVACEKDAALTLLNIPGVIVSEFGDMFLVTVSLSHLKNNKYNKNRIIDIINYTVERGEGGGLCYLDEGESPITIQIVDLMPTVNRFGSDKCVDIFRKHERATVKFICDRGVSHEIVRHRASFAQESTRYCNYGSDRFDGITFIEPSTLDEWNEEDKDRFYSAMEYAEGIYLHMIESGLTPQQARAVLPNALKTEVIMTASLEQWRHFFNLRYFGSTGSPHPDMKHVAEIAYKAMEKEYSFL